MDQPFRRSSEVTDGSRTPPATIALRPSAVSLIGGALDQFTVNGKSLVFSPPFAVHVTSWYASNFGALSATRAARRASALTTRQSLSVFRSTNRNSCSTFPVASSTSLRACCHPGNCGRFQNHRGIVWVVRCVSIIRRNRIGHRGAGRHDHRLHGRESSCRSAAPEEILAVGTEDEHVVPAPRTWIKLAHLFVGFEVPNADRSDAQCCARPSSAIVASGPDTANPTRRAGDHADNCVPPGSNSRVARSSGDLGSRPRASPGKTNDAWFPLRRPECQTQSDRVELNPSKRRATPAAIEIRIFLFLTWIDKALIVTVSGVQPPVRTVRETIRPKLWNRDERFRAAWPAVLTALLAAKVHGGDAAQTAVQPAPPSNLWAMSAH